jgi:hypothetical protein
MKLMKKVAATTLATSLLAGGFAGIPLSQKGILGAFQIQQASATESLPANAAALEARLDSLKAKLVATNNWNTVLAALDELNEDAPYLPMLLGPVWNKIEAKAIAAGKSTQEIGVFKGNLINIATFVTGLDFATGFDKLDTVRVVYYNNFKFLAEITGAETPDIEDLTQFVSELENAFKSYATDTAILNPTNLLSDAMKNVLESVLSTSQTDMADIINGSGITVDDILAAKSVLQSAVPSLKGATTAIAAAYLSIIKPTTDTGGGDTGGNNGGTTTPPADDETGVTEEELEEALEEVGKALEELFDAIPDLDNLTDENIEDLIAALEAAIEKIATLDLSKTVEVKGDVATPKLDEDKLAKQFENISKNVDKVNEKAAGGLENSDKKPKVVATIDLGTVNAKTTEVPITKSLVDKAKAAGIDSLAFKVNGVTLNVDLADLGSDTKLTITKQDNSVATQATDKKLASDVFEFEFTTGTGQASTFTKPVELKLPIPSVAGIDADLLVLAKIINSRLEYYGGKYDAVNKVFNAQRNSFSSYTVVENKVVFNDMATVKDWAGRQVEVTAAKGLIEGRAEGSFVPNESVTRAEFAKMLVKAFNLEDATAQENFADVNASDWFASYVAAAAKAGVINGRTDSEFAPNATITRAEMATMAARALKLAKGYSDADVVASLKGFNDAAEINVSLRAGVALAANKGIIIGESEGQFNPNGNSTRAQAAVVLYRLINK